MVGRRFATDVPHGTTADVGRRTHVGSGHMVSARHDDDEQNI